MTRKGMRFVSSATPHSDLLIVIELDADGDEAIPCPTDSGGDIR